MYFVLPRSHFSLLHMINLRTNNFPTVQYNNRAKVTVNEIDDYDSNERFSFQKDRNHTVQRSIQVKFQRYKQTIYDKVGDLSIKFTGKYRQRYCV